MKPLAIDLFSGLGGWAEGLLATGWEVVGFDIERHVYGDLRYPAQLVLQDVLTIHGSQFRGAGLIVASPPCQEFSYMAMPWARGRAIAAALRGQGAFPEGYRGSRTIPELTALFDACFRIQREASEAAGRHIPLVVENVRGAQPWVGRAAWKYGSYFLWGDIPALMPIIVYVGKHQTEILQGSDKDLCGQKKSGDWFSIGNGRSPKILTEHILRMYKHLIGSITMVDPSLKRPSRNFHGPERGESSPSFNGAEHETRGTKNTGGSWFNIGGPGQRETNRNPVHELSRGCGHVDQDGHGGCLQCLAERGVKQGGSGAEWWREPLQERRKAATKTVGHLNKRDGHSHTRHLTNQAEHVKNGKDWFGSGENCSLQRKASSGSTSRKAASAIIAKIPFALAYHIGQVYLPQEPK